MAFSILFEIAADETDESMLFQLLEIPDKDQKGVFNYKLNLSTVFQTIFS